MNKYAELDAVILESGMPGEKSGCGVADAAVFFLGLKKMAAESPAEMAVGQATGSEPTSDQAEAHYQSAAPDTTGHLEGEFAVPVEQVVMAMSQIVSQNLKQHFNYIYYGETLRDLNRAGLVKLFAHQAKEEVEEAKYFLRRISVLAPGGVPVPPTPAPEPLDDAASILSRVIAGEQQAIVLFKTLHSMLGENPMKFTVEQIMQGAQEHLDRLWQFMPAPGAKTPAAKVAAAQGLMKQSNYRQRIHDFYRNRAAEKGAVDQRLVIPAPGSEPVEAYVSRERELQLAQAEAEKQELAQRLGEADGMVQQHQMQAESMAAESAQLQEQMGMVQQQADMAQQQAAQATELAGQSQEQAAAEADAKMRLAMRIQQFRQQLADIVAADPVQEEGVGFGAQAGAGTPATAQQQQQVAEQQAAEAEQAQLPAKAKKEVSEAQRAQGKAQEQGAQAEAAVQGKTAGIRSRLGDVVRAGKAAPQAAVDAAKAKARAAAGKAREKAKSVIAESAGEAGRSLGQGISEHAQTTGRDLGEAVGHAAKEHSRTVGREMGAGFGEHAEEAARRATAGAYSAVRDWTKKPRVRLGTAIGATGLIGGKIHGMKQQNKRDKVQERIALALEKAND